MAPDCLIRLKVELEDGSVCRAGVLDALIGCSAIAYQVSLEGEKKDPPHGQNFSELSSDWMQLLLASTGPHQQNHFQTLQVYCLHGLLPLL